MKELKRNAQNSDRVGAGAELGENGGSGKTTGGNADVFENKAVAEKGIRKTMKTKD